jgi:Fe2+ transport system protein FeoA
MTLVDLKPGDSFVVEGVSLGRETGKRLADMGFTQGVEGQVVRMALFGDPIQVSILGYQVSIRKSEAAGVDVVKGTLRP